MNNPSIAQVHRGAEAPLLHRIRFWAGVDTIHLLIGGAMVKTVCSHLTVNDLARLVTKGAVNADPSPCRHRDAHSAGAVGCACAKRRADLEHLATAVRCSVSSFLPPLKRRRTRAGPGARRDASARSLRRQRFQPAGGRES